MSRSTLSVLFYVNRGKEADWMAILVGILALLTASLIGWQIYRAIELDRIIRRFDSIVNDRTFAISHDIKNGTFAKSSFSANNYFDMARQHRQFPQGKYILRSSRNSQNTDLRFYKSTG